MRIRAVVLAAALAAAVHSSAAAATPSVDARAYEVVNAATGEVLLTRNARARLPMASVTKLMTVLVALERAKLGEVVTVDSDAVGVTGSGVRLRAGERITVRDLVAAALIQSANDAAIALSAHVGRGDEDAFVELMNRRAGQLGLHSTNFERADGLDVVGHVSTAHDLNRLAQIAMREPVIRELVAVRNTTISGGRSLHTWNDLLGEFPGLIGVKTGHTSDAGWCQVAAARGPGFTVYATILGSPSRGERNADLAELLAFGLSQYRLVPVIAAERTYATTELPYGRDPLAPRRHAAREAAGPAGPRADGARRRAGRRRAPRPQGPAARRGARVRPRTARRQLAARRGALGRASGNRGQGGVVRGQDAPPPRRDVLVIVTVTMNAALDRTLTVPNFQLGQRHRASQVLTLAGGKGINIARALKRLDVPVAASGLAGGRTGVRIVEELTAEAILNDFVRIGDESRTSTAVVDPTANTYTEINEWGPEVGESELELLHEKLLYLARGADVVVFAGTLPRGVAQDFYAESIRELNRRGVRTVLDTEGEPLRLGAGAEPYLVTPNQVEAESLVGQELTEEEEVVQALEDIAELGPRNVLITQESGCYALLREERGAAKRFRATAPRVEALSAVGAGDVLLAGFLAARLEERPAEEALRAAVAAGAASTLEIGAGRFEPREAGRLIAGVEVVELEPVAAH